MANILTIALGVGLGFIVILILIFVLIALALLLFGAQIKVGCQTSNPLPPWVDSVCVLLYGPDIRI